MATFNSYGNMVNAVFSTAANFSAGALLDGQEVLINAGSVDLNGEDVSAIELDLLQVDGTFTKNFGTSGTGVQIDATRFNYFGGGAAAYFDGAFPDLLVDCAGTFGFATTAAAVNSCTRCQVQRGNVIAGVDSATTLAIVRGFLGSSSLTLNASGTITTVAVVGGRFNLYGTGTTVIVGTGAVYTYGGSTMTTGNIYGGSVIGKGGTFGTINLYDGVLDFTQATSQITVSTAINVYGGFIDRKPIMDLGGAVTVNVYGYNKNGWPPGSTFTWTS